MNTSRLVVLGLAAVAAGGAAFLARGLLGGGTPVVQASLAPPITTNEVLVASADLAPGQALLPEEVHWQKWPKSSVDASFMTKQNTPQLEQFVKGTVARAPIVTGEPITEAKIVRSDATGFMAATLTPGMRAVSIPVSVASLAGGVHPAQRPRRCDADLAGRRSSLSRDDIPSQCPRPRDRPGGPGCEGPRQESETCLRREDGDA
ncbi:MAG: Flp pilus assembly protein CpaB [Rhizomicrobium sp.]